MPAFTCPKCGGEDTLDAPNGEWWMDGEEVERDCHFCGVALSIVAQVEITLHVTADEWNGDHPSEPEAAGEVRGG